MSPWLFIESGVNIVLVLGSLLCVECRLYESVAPH